MEKLSANQERLVRIARKEESERVIASWGGRIKIHKHGGFDKMTGLKIALAVTNKKGVNVKKHLCDICGGDLFVSQPYPSGPAEGFSFCNFYKFRKKFSFREFNTSNYPMFWGLGATEKQIEFCSNCYNDFSEFVLRKSKCLGKS